MKTMIVDSHQHVMLPTSMQVKKMDDAGVDKAILFTTTPHVERAESATLEAIGVEMQVLYQLLSGSYSPETRISKMKDTILELNQAIQVAPDRFCGFGPVPLGLSEQATAEWVSEYIAGNSFKGIGEFTPGSETQIEQLEPVFKALEDYHSLPIWVHTFNPVTLDGIKILMELCRKNACSVLMHRLGSRSYAGNLLSSSAPHTLSQKWSWAATSKGCCKFKACLNSGVQSPAGKRQSFRPAWPHVPATA